MPATATTATPGPFGRSATSQVLRSGQGDTHPTTLDLNQALRLARLTQDGQSVLLTAKEARHASALLAAFASAVGA